MAHGVQKAPRPRDLAVPGARVEKVDKRCFHLAGAPGKSGLEWVVGSLVHGGAMAANAVAVKPDRCDRALRGRGRLLYAVCRG